MHIKQDSVIIPRISMYPQDHREYTDKTVEHMEHFAKEGFRTLVLAYRVISDEDYQVSDTWDKTIFPKSIYVSLQILLNLH